MTTNSPIVLGAGIAGLAAAAALRQRHPEVIVLERDQSTAGERRGVPQSGQLHNLLSRAQQHLDELFPGFTDELIDRGASAASAADETHVHEFGVTMPRRRLGLRLVCTPRPLLDAVARSRLEAMGGVTFIGGATVAGLRLRDRNVAGVEVEVGASRQAIPADIVVDALGAASPVAGWLAAGEHGAPRHDTERSDHWYTTTLFARPDVFVDDPRFWLVFPSGDQTRGVLVSPAGPDRWYVSVSGRRSDPIPRTVDQVRHHVATIHDAQVAVLLDGGEAVAAPTTFRKTTATWRRYDLLDSPIAGLLPVGDAVAAVNPIFGQGVSIAAWEAAELAAVLSESDRPLTEVAATRDYLARAGAVAARAWTLSSTIQSIVTVDETTRRQFVARLVEDAEIHRRYVATWHLLEHPAALAELVTGPALARRTMS